MKLHIFDALFATFYLWIANRGHGGVSEIEKNISQIKRII